MHVYITHIVMDEQIEFEQRRHWQELWVQHVLRGARGVSLYEGGSRFVYIYI